MIRPSLTAMVAAAMVTMVPPAAAHDLEHHVFDVQRMRYLMGTLCLIAAQGPDSAAAATAVERGLDEIAALEAVLSNWRTDSELMTLNARGPDGHGCSPALFAVLDSASTLAEASDGAFDPTIEPLNLAWDARGAGRMPSADTLAAARALVDWRQLVIDRGTRRVALGRSGMGVDLGGIGKGFALDRAADTLRARGARHALLNLGGEILSIGRWNVTVAHPEDRMTPAFWLDLEDAAISTSAQSERATTVAGRRQGHIFDPRTGAPVEFTGSVSVVASSATRADALSTALLVMGREVARDWARAHPEIGVLWVEPNRRGLAAWRWNLPHVETGRDVKVRWKQ